MKTKLQSIDPERVGKEEGSRQDAWIFLENNNRIGFAGGLGAGGDGSKRDQDAVEMRYREPVQGEMIQLGGVWGQCENLIQWKPPGIYEGDPRENSQ